MKNKIPAITVIVPIYNVSPYLKQCLDSLIAQTFDNFEVIGIDDGSSDSSGAIFAEYLHDSRFNLYFNYENQGLPSARNVGIVNSKGQYLYFLDSDDWIGPQALEQLYEVAQEDKVDIVIGGLIKYYDETGKLKIADNHARLMSVPKSGIDIRTDPNLFWSVISANKLIKSDFIKHQGLYFKQTPRRYEDMATYKWYLCGAKVTTLDVITYFYRQRCLSNGQTSIMQDKSMDAFIDKILAFDDILRFTKNKGLLLTDLDPMHSQLAMMNLPRALTWIYKDVFTKNKDDLFGLQKFILANRQLLSLFNDSYIHNLPVKVKEIAGYILESDPRVCVDRCVKAYS